jgi:hypothetical protein
MSNFRHAAKIAGLQTHGQVVAAREEKSRKKRYCNRGPEYMMARLNRRRSAIRVAPPQARNDRAWLLFFAGC